jgi:hypothetical protein
MLRQPAIFLAGCSSAEPASASYRYCKLSRISNCKVNKTEKCDKLIFRFYKEKRSKKRKEEKEWAIAHESFL